MAYSAEESSPVTYITETCCVCDEEFSSDTDLANHLVEHADDDEFKAGLLEIEKKTPTKPTNNINAIAKVQVPKINMPVKRTASQRSSTPEVWEIISDDSDDESNKNKKSANKSNSFRLVSTSNKPSNLSSTPSNSLPSKTVNIPNLTPINVPNKTVNTPINLPANVQNKTNNAPSNVQTKKGRNRNSNKNIQKVQNNTVSTPKNVANKPPEPAKVQNGQIYKCNVCTAVFNDPNVLKDHLLAHDKEKQYVCHICKKQFLHRATLRQHLHQHISDKSHQCKVCNKKFSLKSVLRKHEETHFQSAQQSSQGTSQTQTRRQKSLP